jgi:tetratricopeptide (TPR) repeat protein
LSRRTIGRAGSKAREQWLGSRGCSWTGLAGGLLWVALGTGMVSAHAALPSAQSCGPLKADNYGPFDYRFERGEPLRLVEGAHFIPRVEALIGGKSGRLGSELTYTLRAFPNHHRALVSMMRYAENTQRDPPPDMMYTAECWFERAIRFARDDAIVRMLYAKYLTTKGRTAEALAQVDLAVEMGGDNPMTPFSAGLILLELKEYDRANEMARRATALGNPRGELKDALVAAGKWREEASPPAPAGSAASAAAAQ